jgi:hypothetical protein
MITGQNNISFARTEQGLIQTEGIPFMAIAHARNWGEIDKLSVG